MKDITFENTKHGLCVVCGKPIITVIKSDCCNAHPRFKGSITCCSECHEELVIAAEKAFGKFKKVVDATTNKVYKVPTRDIIENGLTQTHLPKYPMWEEL